MKRLFFKCLIVLVGAWFPGQVHAETLVLLNFDEPSGMVLDHGASGSHCLAQGSFRGVVVRSSDNPFREAGNQSLQLDASLPKAGDGNVVAVSGSVGSTNNSFTIEGWIKPTREDSMTLFQGYLGSSRFSAAIGLSRKENENGVRAACYLGALSKAGNGEEVMNERRYVDSNVIPLNKWIHLALSYGKQRMDFYVNGELIYSEKTFAVTIPEGMGQVCFSGGAFGNLTGYIDDLRWSDQTLAPGELGYHKSLSVK